MDLLQHQHIKTLMKPDFLHNNTWLKDRMGSTLLFACYKKKTKFSTLNIWNSNCIWLSFISSLSGVAEDKISSLIEFIVEMCVNKVKYQREKKSQFLEGLSFRLLSLSFCPSLSSLSLSLSLLTQMLTRHMALCLWSGCPSVCRLCSLCSWELAPPF